MKSHQKESQKNKKLGLWTVSKKVAKKASVFCAARFML